MPQVGLRITMFWFDARIYAEGDQRRGCGMGARFQPGRRRRQSIDSLRCGRRQLKEKDSHYSQFT